MKCWLMLVIKKHGKIDTLLLFGMPLLGGPLKPPLTHVLQKQTHATLATHATHVLRRAKLRCVKATLSFVRVAF